jgi:hypothetical protein
LDLVVVVVVVVVMMSWFLGAFSQQRSQSLVAGVQGLQRQVFCLR